jgi:molybdopterin-guanine dinucleotide biosynthesis protein A
MLEAVVRRMTDLCDVVVVVLAPRAAEPPLSGIAVRFARDAAEGEGPLAGLAAGLGVVRTRVALVAGGDMPELEPAVLAELVRVAEAGAPSVALEDAGRARPLPCALRVGPAVEGAARLLAGGRRRLRDLLEELGTTVVDEASWRALDPTGRTLFDVDEPGDLEP